MRTHPSPNPFEGTYDQLHLRYDRDQRTVWCVMHPCHRPCFNHDLLRELHSFQDSLVASNRAALDSGQPMPSLYTVLSSSVAGVFNLGGDLDLFAKLIRAHDRDALLRYATACIDVLYPNAVSFHLPMTTISLVQGDALAGGFEAAISSNVVIAERRARFGLPEVRFNLIPGMGAYTFLMRRAGPRVAERLIMGGEVLSAETMHDLGLVDLVVDDGTGEQAVADYIVQHGRRANAYAAFKKVRDLVNPITHEELMAVTTVWVDAALRITERDLRVIDRLVRAQSHFVEAAASLRAKAATG